MGTRFAEGFHWRLYPTGCDVNAPNGIPKVVEPNQLDLDLAVFPSGRVERLPSHDLVSRGSSTNVLSAAPGVADYGDNSTVTAAVRER